MESSVALCLFLDDVIAIVVCPYCSSKHKHPAGVLGPRAAHCGIGEYLIGAPITDVELGQSIKQHKAKIASQRKKRADASSQTNNPATK